MTLGKGNKIEAFLDEKDPRIKTGSKGGAPGVGSGRGDPVGKLASSRDQVLQCLMEMKERPNKLYVF